MSEEFNNSPEPEETPVTFLARRLQVRKDDGRKRKKKPGTTTTRVTYRSPELPLQQFVLGLTPPELYVTVDAVDLRHARSLVNQALVTRGGPGGSALAGSVYDFVLSGSLTEQLRPSGGVRRFHILIAAEDTLLHNEGQARVIRQEYLRPVAAYRFTDAKGRSRLMDATDDLPEPGPGERLEPLYVGSDEGICVPAPTDVYEFCSYPIGLSVVRNQETYDPRFIAGTRASRDKYDEEEEEEEEDI